MSAPAMPEALAQICIFINSTVTEFETSKMQFEARIKGLPPHQQAALRASAMADPRWIALEQFKVNAKRFANLLISGHRGDARDKMLAGLHQVKADAARLAEFQLAGFDQAADEIIQLGAGGCREALIAGAAMQVASTINGHAAGNA
jgi:hypothetical protein